MTAGDHHLVVADQQHTLVDLEGVHHPHHHSQQQQFLISGSPQSLQSAAGTANEAPATIDVTNAAGEVVQQFILPPDLQLEEGQTLIMIQDEDGQPQLAIVNQAGKF
ncbi:unnamed protein product [Protopolystoma xenopodis]|uniref:Uncharacterized protein n=1 Tax=Protopolystoma xenopodis TaxID=117903 RepID=A0A3S5AHF2_9PLAT|nr:unnamed protein product [Protopolystoma xenopodis]